MRRSADCGFNAASDVVRPDAPGLWRTLAAPSAPGSPEAVGETQCVCLAWRAHSGGVAAGHTDGTRVTALRRSLSLSISVLRANRSSQALCARAACFANARCASSVLGGLWRLSSANAFAVRAAYQRRAVISRQLTRPLLVNAMFGGREKRPLGSPTIVVPS